VLFALLLAAWAAPPAAAGVQLDGLTWMEVRDALRAGSTTILVPIGGTEQNGPHMAVGKHNVRVGRLAERIAAQLGHTLVAPVVAYVPEAAGHMRFPGTISVSGEAFTGIVTGAARSLRQHGFRDIVLLGDSGDYQPLLRQAGERLNREWAGSGARVHYGADRPARPSPPCRECLACPTRATCIARRPRSSSRLRWPGTWNASTCPTTGTTRCG
jgi:creatinine amidohydrolase